MPLDIPKIVSPPAEYQKAPGSYVVNNGVVNCTCGALKKTVKLVVKDRGSDAGGQPICMDTDREDKNFSSSFGKCSKTGKDCVLTAMHGKWHIPVKVPSYTEWIPKPIPRGTYTVKDTNLIVPITIKPVVLESSLICWHNGTAGMITIDQNGQFTTAMIDFPPKTGYSPVPTSITMGGGLAITAGAVAIAVAIVGMFIVIAALTYTLIQIQQLIQMGLIRIQFGIIQWTAEGIQQYNYYFGDNATAEPKEDEKPKSVPKSEPKEEGEEEGEDEEEWDGNIDNLPEGWTKTENNGRIHVRDEDGNIRTRVDPPDSQTEFTHRHNYDVDGNSLDSDGNTVPYNSPDAHIPYP